MKSPVARALSRASLACSLVAVAAIVAGCSTEPGSGVKTATSSSSGTHTSAAASINAWGSILAQLGGTRVATTSLITNPDTDPHSYEPTPADARIIAGAALFIVNGTGYDSWASKAVAASPDPHRIVLNVAELTKTPADGNPHLWYSPSNVEKVADQITADLKHLDPAGSDYFETLHQSFVHTDLAEYHRLITDIRTKYAGTPVGASESIFAPLADALGLNLITPQSFLKAISEGTDPSTADKATIDSQISGKKIKLYVYNSQNATPDVAAQVSAAKKYGIAVSTVTETLSPAGASFEQWQVSQLKAIEAALAQATAT